MSPFDSREHCPYPSLADLEAAVLAAELEQAVLAEAVA